MSLHPREAAIALGSNLGDRADRLAFAVERLRAVLDEMRVSRVHETSPEGVAPQPPFLNAVVVGRTRLDPLPLFELLQAIERAGGRERPYRGAPRTLDLDLVLLGDVVVRTPALEIPHPRFRARRFVLEPLVEVAPHLVDPVTGLTVRQLLNRLDLPRVTS